MRSYKLAIPICVLLVAVAQMGADKKPPGLEEIFNKVDPGRPFHPFWPPLVGDDAVGTIVVAGHTDKIETLFETIESPDFAAAAQTQFQKKSYPIVGVDFNRKRDIGADLAFKQLDAISDAIKSGRSSSNVVAKVPAQPCRSSDENPTAESSKKPGAVENHDSDKKTNSASDAGLKKDGKPEESATSSNGKKSAKDTGNAKSDSSKSVDCSKDEAGRTSTGIDFGKVSQATVTIPKLTVKFYTLATLQKMEKTGPDGLLNATGRQALGKETRGWIISRVLIAESMDYDLTASTKFEAGFFAKLLAWLPTASVKYKNANTISISTNSPVILGYKLWRPGLKPLQEAAAENATVDISADDIDKVLNGTYDPN